MEEGSEGAPSVHRQEARHVLINDPLGSNVVNKSKIGEGEVAARIGESFAESCDAECLAGRASDQNVN
jgi:hypothetical protein